MPREVDTRVRSPQQHLQQLQIFLSNAPALINDDLKRISPSLHHEPRCHRFMLPSGEFISCVWWQGAFYITGTDILRSLSFRFEMTGRGVRQVKKFEEGVFSDLRNLKPGSAAVLEESKSPFLDYLFRNQCIRTQKKQKVFYWFEVDHDRLYLDALDRDIKREKAGAETTTGGSMNPDFAYDPNSSLSDQFLGSVSDGMGDGNLERMLRQYDSDPRRQASSSSHSGTRDHYFSPGQASSSSSYLEYSDAYRSPSVAPRPMSPTIATHGQSWSGSYGREIQTPMTGDMLNPYSPMGSAGISQHDWQAYMSSSGGAYETPMSTMVPSAELDQQRYSCAVPSCRQVFVGMRAIQKHMRSHNFKG